MTIQTQPTQIVKVYFLLENRFLKDFKYYWCTKSITFCLDLMRNKTLKARNSTPTHTYVFLQK